MASRNKKKIAEMTRILQYEGITLRSLDDFPDCPETEETENTFEGNSMKKASEVAAHTGLPALSDDSGLVVDALDGRPGVLSARYAGIHATDADNSVLLLKELGSTPAGKRSARFVCVLSLCMPNGDGWSFRGTVEGAINDGPRGESGFGYDPVFIPEGHKRTFAEMTGSEKDTISHRGRALLALAEFLAKGWPPKA